MALESESLRACQSIYLFVVLHLFICNMYCACSSLHLPAGPSCPRNGWWTHVSNTWPALCFLVQVRCRLVLDDDLELAVFPPDKCAPQLVIPTPQLSTAHRRLQVRLRLQRGTEGSFCLYSTCGADSVLARDTWGSLALLTSRILLERLSQKSIREALAVCE